MGMTSSTSLPTGLPRRPRSSSRSRSSAGPKTGHSRGKPKHAGWCPVPWLGENCELVGHWRMAARLWLVSGGETDLAGGWRILETEEDGASLPVETCRGECLCTGLCDLDPCGPPEPGHIDPWAGC